MHSTRFNRACPHGTSAKPARGATRLTSQQSSEVVAAVAGAIPTPLCRCWHGRLTLLVFVLVAAAAVVVPPLPWLQGLRIIADAETAGDCKHRCRIVTNRM